jgi:hypothetical protein
MLVGAHAQNVGTALKQLHRFLHGAVIQINDVPFLGVQSDEVLIHTSCFFASVGIESTKVSSTAMSRSYLP